MGAACEGRTAAAWAIGVLGSGWLLMRLWCYLGLPNDCEVPVEAMDVITSLVVLLAFGVAQAWFCNILEEERFRKILQSFLFPIFYFASGPVVSALQNSDGIPSVGTRLEDFSDTESTLSIIFFALVVVFVLWHLFLAWTELPGMSLVSGSKSPGDAPSLDPESRFGYYIMSRFVALLLFFTACAILFEDGEGWGYRYALLAWLLSLIAQFNRTMSIFWLAITTGVFVQGIGAYGVNFLLPQ